MAPPVARTGKSRSAEPLLLLGLLALSFMFLAGTGLSLGHVFATLLVVSLQVFAGWLLAGTLLPRVVADRGGRLGLGVALGTGSAIVAALLPWPAGLRRWSWLLLVVSIVFGVFAYRRWRRPLPVLPFGDSDTVGPGGAGFAARPVGWGSSEALLALLVVGAGLCTALPMALDHPLALEGWWRFHQDYQFHEAVSSSVHYLGRNDTLWFAGEPFRYHWFVHLWAGALTEALVLPPFAAMTRLTYLVGVVGSVLLSWGIARMLTPSRWAPPVAAAASVVGTYVGIPLSVGSTIGAAAPTQAMGSIWLLGGVFLALALLRGTAGSKGVLTALALMAFLSIGSKVNHGVILMGGVGFVAFLAVLGRLADVRASAALRVGFAALGGAGAGFLVAIWGTSGGLTVGFNAAFADAVGLTIGSGRTALVSGAALAVLAVGTRWVGVVMPPEPGQRNRGPERALAVGVAVTGLATTFLFVQSGRSQDHFALSATLVLAVLSAALVIPRFEVSVRSTRLAVRPWSRRWSSEPVSVGMLVVVLGGLGGVSGAAWFYLDRGGLMPAGVAWLGVLMPWIVGLIALLLVQRTVQPLDGSSRWAFLSTAVLISSVAAGLLYPVLSLPGLRSDSRQAGPADAASSLAVHPDHLEAAAWLFENSQEGEVVATNRLCSSPSDRPPDCGSLWYLGSAASRRPFLVEGFGYGVRRQEGILSGAMEEMPELSRRVEASMALALAPSDRAIEELAAQGVVWYWLDRRVEHDPAIDRLLDVEYANQEVALFRLD